MTTTTQQTIEVENKRGQVVQTAAEIYETFFVPALFQQWPPLIADLVHLKTTDQVLDVACGTGVVAGHFTERLENPGQVYGVDINEGMLSVARRNLPRVQWKQASVEHLPFEENYFDKVVCQFGLMFFEDRAGAVKEMMRVTKPGGAMVILVWDKLENSPGYQRVADLLQNLFGDVLANEIRAPFVLGDRQKLINIMQEAGVEDFEIKTQSGTAQFPSIDDWIFTDIKGWTLADLMTEEQFQVFSHEAGRVLKQYLTPDGVIAFEAPAHIVVVLK